MEQKYIYAVYDEFDGFFGNLFVATNDLIAARIFRQSFNPEERSFHLYRLGAYAPCSGAVVASDLTQIDRDGNVIQDEKPQ